MAYGDILVVDSVTRRIYTLRSGSWNAGLAVPAAVTNPQGVAVDPTNGNVVVASASDRRVYRYDGTSWTSIAAPTAATDLTGITVDTNGDVLIADDATNRVYRHNGTAWVATTIAARGLSPAGMTLDPNDRDIIVVEGLSVEQFGAGTHTLSLPTGTNYYVSGRGADAGSGTGATFPSDTTVRRSDTVIFTAESGDTSGEIGTEVAELMFSNTSGSDVTLNISVPAAGVGGTNLYMVGFTNDALYTLNRSTGRATQVGSATAFDVGETSPSTLAWASGRLYMAGGATNRLYTLDLATGAATRVGTSTNFGVNQSSPQGMAWDGTNLYMVGANPVRLYTLDLATGAATRVGTSTNFGVGESAPRGLAWDGTNLYMVGSSNFALYTVSRTTGIATRVNSSADQFGVSETIPLGLTWAIDNLYMVGARHDTLYTVSRTTGMATRIGSETAFGVGETAPHALAAVVGSNGVNDGWVRIRTAPIAALAAPAIPTNLRTRSLAATSVILDCDDATNADGYIWEWRAGTSGVWSSATTTASEYSLTGLTASTAYQFRVTATRSGASNSAASSPVSFTTSAAGAASITFDMTARQINAAATGAWVGDIDETFTLGGQSYTATALFTHNNGIQIRFSTNAQALAFIAADFTMDSGITGQSTFKTSAMDNINSSLQMAAQYQAFAGRYVAGTSYTITITDD